MEFNDGDKIIGHAGTVTERVNGRWLMGNYVEISEDTVRWLLSLDLRAEARPIVDNKISKSAKEQIPPAIYKWKLVRKRLI